MRKARLVRNWGFQATNGKKLSPLAKPHQGAGKCISQPQSSLQRIQSLLTLCLQPHEIHPAATPKFLTHRNWELINVCCCKLLFLGKLLWRNRKKYNIAAATQAQNPVFLKILKFLIWALGGEEELSWEEGQRAQHVGKWESTMQHLQAFIGCSSAVKGICLGAERNGWAGCLPGANYGGVVYAIVEMFGLYPTGNKELWPITNMDQDSEGGRFCNDIMKTNNPIFKIDLKALHKRKNINCKQISI